MKLPRERLERLQDGTPYLGAKYGDDFLIEGAWQMYLKVDGIRYIRGQDGRFYTRGNKELHPNVYKVVPDWVTDFELFRNDWSTSMGLKAGTVVPHPSDIYSLYPHVDERLHLYEEQHMAANNKMCLDVMNFVVSNGYEGIVIRQGKKWVKFVPVRTADVVINGFKEGTKRLAKSLGALTTPLGNVGTGFTDEQRKWLWTHRTQIIGMTIEVAYREVTKDGKLRMPRFVRFRDDKKGDNHV